MSNGAARTKVLNDRHGRHEQRINRRAKFLREEIAGLRECREMDKRVIEAAHKDEIGDLKLKLAMAEELLDSAPAIFHEVVRASALGFLGRLWWGLRFTWRGRIT